MKRIELMKQNLRKWARNELGDDYYLFDIDANIDSDLTFDENKTILYEKIRYFKENDIPEEVQEYYANQERKANQVQPSSDVEEILPKLKSIAILGATRSGKTALSFKFLEVLAKDRPIFILRHPIPQLILTAGYKILPTLADIEKLQDCVLYIDEPQIHMGEVGQAKANYKLAKLLSLCGQRNITLILSTSDTRFITRGVEAYIDAWVVKDIEPALTKRGSMINKVIRGNAFLDIEGWSLDVNEYLFYARGFNYIYGKRTFNLAQNWNESLSTPYRIQPRTQLRNEVR